MSPVVALSSRHSPTPMVVRFHSAPGQYPSSGSEEISPSQKIEEKLIPGYDPAKFYPVFIEDVKITQIKLLELVNRLACPGSKVRTARLSCSHSFPSSYPSRASNLILDKAGTRRSRYVPGSLQRSSSKPRASSPHRYTCNHRRSSSIPGSRLSG